MIFDGRICLLTLLVGAGCMVSNEAAVYSRSGVVVHHVEASSVGSRLRLTHARSSSSSEKIRQGDLAVAQVAMALHATDGQGLMVSCEDAKVDVDISVSENGSEGPYEPVASENVRVDCKADAPMDVALVLDNSGSQERVLEETKIGAIAFIDDVLDHGGRVSVTRVSTQSVVLHELSSDRKSLHQAIEGLFVNAGWTALYDGVRTGHETLGRALMLGEGEAEGENVESCRTRRRTAVVLFTNGVDNNSSDQKLDKLSDGIDTEIKDLEGLNIAGVKTPVFSIGLGKEVDADKLQDLSNQTGGRYLAIGDPSGLEFAFERVAEYMGESVQVCATLPLACGPLSVKVDYSFRYKDGVYTSQDVYDTIADCPTAPPSGKIATVVMTLSNKGVPKEVVSTLANNVVKWVGNKEESKVLVVRDDNHHGEMANDVPFIRGLLMDGGHDVKFIEEPRKGLRPKDIEGYDVVWFSNPGWPVDDLLTIETLTDFVGQGGGVVLSGDDITWSMGHAFSMSDLTRVKHDNNGGSICGKRTDNNKKNQYRVSFGDSAHPVAAGLGGVSLQYGDDLDHSTPLGTGEEVLAWATLDSSKSCETKVPVVVVFEPKSKSK